MAIVSFWSDIDKETAQTLSLVALATHMSVEHNYKTLIIDATLNDDTMQRCFWNLDENKEIKKTLNKGKLDIAAGTEGLVSAIASNKTSPEIIANYTKVVFNKRLDILVGLQTKNFQDHEKTLMLYPELVLAANKFYDLIMIDLPKTAERESVHEILKMSDVIMYTLAQNMKQINRYIELRDDMPELKSKMVIPIVGSANGYSKYNPKNMMAYIKDRSLAYINYNNSFMEAASEAKVSSFFLNSRLYKKTWDRNSQFFTSIADTSRKIMDKFEEMKYGKVLKS